MSTAKCAACGKTAYPLESVTALEKAYHKGCFKCAVCNATLNLKNFKGVEGKIYCTTHTPKPTATAVTDSIATKQALNAPKKTAEGLSKVQKGTGDKAVGVGLDSVSTKNALNAPKKVAEGLGSAQKGSGGKPNYAVFGADGSSTTSTGAGLDAEAGVEGEVAAEGEAEAGYEGEAAAEGEYAEEGQEYAEGEGEVYAEGEVEAEVGAEEEGQ
eukprot:TRINITY_DN129_c0_g1_i4.p2 TRINITY_DN129_c0_g1~~TRINITY_DN129_c0_g1_i4.p2  ORF type:complete len:213 (+),score=72.22 TRINITY_DN129_c0_g1_i4:70-708(+)